MKTALQLAKQVESVVKNSNKDWYIIGYNGLVIPLEKIAYDEIFKTVELTDKKGTIELLNELTGLLTTGGSKDNMITDKVLNMMVYVCFTSLEKYHGLNFKNCIMEQKKTVRTGFSNYTKSKRRN